MTRRTLTASSRRPLVIALCVISAALMVVSGAIHLHLWDNYYRYVTTGHMNVLFMVQLIAAFLGAAVLLALRNLLVVLGCAALMAGTAVGYLIARYNHGGLFGFYLGSSFSSSDATRALTVEIVSTVFLLATALILTLSGPNRATVQ
jgi:hypothetical protein